METDGNPGLKMHSALVMINLKVLQRSMLILTDGSIDILFSLLHLNAVSVGFPFCMNRTIYIIFIKTLCCAKCIISQKRIVVVFPFFKTRINIRVIQNIITCMTVRVCVPWCIRQPTEFCDNRGHSSVDERLPVQGGHVRGGGGGGFHLLQPR